METFINDYSKPFKSIKMVYEAILVYSKLIHIKDSQPELIAKCINLCLNLELSVDDVKRWIHKIESHKDLYPVQTIMESSIILESVNNFLKQNNIPNSEFITKQAFCMECHKSFGERNTKISYQAIIYFNTFYTQTTINSFIKCKICCTETGYWYYISKDKTRKFVKNFLAYEFISFTNKTIFEKKLFDTLSADIYFKHSSFQGFSGTYNSILVQSINKRDYLQEKRLVESWFYLNYLLFCQEIGQVDKFDAPFIENIDDALSKIRTKLFPHFVSKWTGAAHKNACKHKHCSKAIVFDGNWKTARMKCADSQLHIKSDELDLIQIGCVNTPERGSYYCENHKRDEPTLGFYVNNVLVPIRLSTIKEAGCFIKKRKIKKIHDVYCLDEEKEENILYLVESEGCYENSLYWVRETHIPKELLQMFIKEQDSKLNINVYNDISCNTNKHFKMPYVKKTKTRGVLIAASNCGIVTGYREIFGCESISQVVLFYLDLIEESKNNLPDIFIYDDACHLKKFISLPKKDFKSKSVRSKILLNKKHVIDRFHFNGHKDAWCKLNCNPNDVPELKDINTSVCEQLNFWLGGYKFMLKHMNYARFHFFLYVILNKYNLEVLKSQK